MIVRTLGPGDEPALEAFLRHRAETAMFLRSNLRRAGIVDTGAPFTATYVAALEKEDGEAMVGAAAHCWNGVVLLHAPVACEALAVAATRATGRPVRGFAGPWEQLGRAREALGLSGTPAAMQEREDLFVLSLSRLALPSPLAGATVRVALPEREEEMDLLSRWRAAYAVERLGAVVDDDLLSRSRREIDELVSGGDAFVLEVDGAPAAFSAYNARLPDIVQVGGVYTPPQLRGRGYARAVVAGSLRASREQGVERAVLFTGRDNAPAQAAYRALGFQVTGEYGLILLA